MGDRLMPVGAVEREGGSEGERGRGLRGRGAEREWGEEEEGKGGGGRWR